VVSALSAHVLTFEYPRARAGLMGVTFDIAPGELLCVVGPNGSGKSTLLRLCAGLLTPQAGSLAVGGAELARLPARERARRIAYVPQALQAVPDLGVRAFVLGGRYAHHPRWAGVLTRTSAADHAAVTRALEEADALELAERQLAELSLGQFQRVRIARALAQEAPLLLFDEPTAALDPEHEVRLFLLIEHLVRAGRSALVVTHALSLASRFAQRTLVLAGGRLAAEGASERVFTRTVLAPVFGPHLHLAEVDGCPLVVPWPQAPSHSNAILARPAEDLRR
jgi:iron complex transport system ATP-binding protein